MAAISAIYLRPSSRTPVRSVDRARLVPGSGVEGDHAGGGNRQITLLDLGAWKEACSELRVELDPGARRANVVIDGLDLAHSRGRRLVLGDAVVEIVGETVPCRLMEDTQPGLMEALRPDWRGGAYGKVLEGGEIAVGDAVRFEGS
jgi:MOSC domain-containing protein YiiM